MRQPLLRVLALGLLALAAPRLAAQHGHLNAGALGENQGDQLYFVNGDIFAESSGYVKDLTFASTGTYAGYYQGGITLTSLAATVDNGGPAFGHAALGSFLEFGIVSVTGPAGGEFGFWEEGAAMPSVSYSAGFMVASATDLFDLSDVSSGAGTAGGDPFGHLHGRRFTATEVGDYVVGFQVYDTSSNGTGGGPIHTSSETLFVQFTAVPEPEEYAAMAGAALVAFAVWRRRRA